jgi:glycosyltransferase involved in cell wall biosynthesis
VTGRVLLVSPTAANAGSERVLLGLARQLPAHGYEPVPVVLEHGPLVDWLAEAGAPAIVLEAGRLRQLDRTAAVVLDLRRLAARVGATAIVSSQWKAHVYASAAALGTGLTTVWWQHSVALPRLRDRLVGRLPAAAIVCSSQDAARAQRAFSPRRRVATVYPGLPLDEVERRRGAGRTLRRELGWSDRPLVGIVGRLDSWKRQDVFLRAAAEVGARRPDVRFAVVGGSPQDGEGGFAGELRGLAHELGLGGRVHFTGEVADAYAWLDALDVVVHCSTREPFGLVVLEAMALGKPVVATGAGGPPEIVGDSGAAVLVEAGDVRAIAGAVTALVDDPGAAAELGARAHERAQRFSEDAMAGSLAAVLAELEAAGRPGFVPAGAV